MGRLRKRVVLELQSLGSEGWAGLWKGGAYEEGGAPGGGVWGRAGRRRGVEVGEREGAIGGQGPIEGEGIRRRGGAWGVSGLHGHLLLGIPRLPPNNPACRSPPSGGLLPGSR